MDREVIRSLGLRLVSAGDVGIMEREDIRTQAQWSKKHCCFEAGNTKTKSRKPVSFI